MKDNSRSFQKFKKAPLIFSIVFLALSSYSFVFLYKQIENNKKVSAQIQTEWQTEASRRNEIKVLDRLMREMGEERRELENHFAYSTNIVPFLDNIEQLGVQVGTRTEVSSVDILKDKSGLVVDIKVSGSFESIYKFLTLLENSPYELEFILIDMQKLDVPEWDGNFKVKLLSFIQ